MTYVVSARPISVPPPVSVLSSSGTPERLCVQRGTGSAGGSGSRTVDLGAPGVEPACGRAQASASSNAASSAGRLLATMWLLSTSWYSQRGDDRARSAACRKARAPGPSSASAVALT